jgi:hypothetical protein
VVGQRRCRGCAAQGAGELTTELRRYQEVQSGLGMAGERENKGRQRRRRMGDDGGTGR